LKIKINKEYLKTIKPNLIYTNSKEKLQDVSLEIYPYP